MKDRGNRKKADGVKPVVDGLVVVVVVVVDVLFPTMRGKNV